MPKDNSKQKKQAEAKKRWDTYYENERQRLTGEHLTGKNNPVLVALREYADDKKRKDRDARWTRDFRGGNPDGPSSIRHMDSVKQSTVRAAHSALHLDFSDAKKASDDAVKTKKFLEDDRRKRAAAKKSAEPKKK